MKIRKTLVLGALLAGAALFPGCRSIGSNAATGAAIGGLLGAGGGYAIGHHRGNTANYALAIGAGGALVGYIIGDAIDDRERDATVRGPQPVAAGPGYGGDCVVVRERVVGPCDDPLPPGW
jgi:hypothetical protein